MLMWQVPKWQPPYVYWYGEILKGDHRSGTSGIMYGDRGTRMVVRVSVRRPSAYRV